MTPVIARQPKIIGRQLCKSDKRYKKLGTVLPFLNVCKWKLLSWLRSGSSWPRLSFHFCGDGMSLNVACNSCIQTSEASF